MKNYTTLVIAGIGLLTASTANAVISLDLTTADQTGTINGAIFQNVDISSTGTGVIDSFVRIQQSGTEQGFNADARPVMSDVNTSPTFTKDILLSAFSEVSIGGFLYYEFLLDINQTNADPLLSMDQLQIYTRATALTDANDLTDLTAAPSVLRYNMDGLADNEVLLDYSLNSGSGSGDLFVYVLKSVFGTESDFVYLYSQFGAKGGLYATNDGFEEWATRTPSGDPPPVPEGGSTLMLLGAALAGMFGLSKFRSRKIA